MRSLGTMLLACVSSVAAHGAIVSPRSRNSLDYLVNVNTQTCANLTGDKCTNGQASFWYSQGCFIGCDKCDHKNGRIQADLCGKGFNATITDPRFRTVNRFATALSPDDIYKHNPWRAPGLAPVADACGLAGGTPWSKNVSEEGKYINTSFAHHGMKGSELPPMETGVSWTIGGEAEVSWQVRNNHGGGYSYRLCPAGEPLSEACFQRSPLDFVRGKSALVFANGTRLPIPGVFVDEGTTPRGSTWALIPIAPTWLGPRCLPPSPPYPNSTHDECEAWENQNIDGPCEPCPQSLGSDCSRCDNNGTPSFAPYCDAAQGCAGVGDGDQAGHVAALDVVKVPSGLKPGKYVLGWRYDCEATAQVWSNCADVTLVSAVVEQEEKQ